MSAPMVSIIVPVYNEEKYLTQCLESIANQTMSSIEVICVDDGSTDNSLSIINEYVQNDNRFKALIQDNLGAGAARNKGIEIATGKYLMFLDADDYFSKDMIEICLKTIESERSDIVIFSAKKYDMRTGKTEVMPWSLKRALCPTFSPFSASDMSKYIFNAFQNWPWNKMFRASFINKHKLFFQEIPRTNDMAFVCTSLVLAKKISILSIPLTTYRTGTATSLQSTNDKFPCSFWDAYVETKNRLINIGLYFQYEQSYLNAVLGGIYYNFNSVHLISSRQKILLILQKNAEREFGFLEHERTFYYDPNPYDWYILAMKSARGGRANILWRDMKRGANCLREHGFKFTFFRILEKLHLR